MDSELLLGGAERIYQRLKTVNVCTTCC